NSTVSGNRATGGYESFGFSSIGGGVANGGSLTVINSTISGNRVQLNQMDQPGSGGGVSNLGTLVLTQSTVSDNFGGGVHNGPSFSTGHTLTLDRTLVSGNAPTEVINLDGNTVIANAFNLFGLNGAAGVSGFSPGPTEIVPVGPLSSILAPLADNGGPTKTHALVAGSPAVDAVKRGCPPPFTDQRGFARPADGDGEGRAECDAGAFERAARPLPTCETAQPTRGCTVNGVANRLCQGTARGDQIFGTHRDDVIFGLDGNDRINGLSGNDLICGGKGKDILRGKMGRDRVFGGAGDDNLQGGSGNDLLSGEGGKDWLFGDRGDDALDGGADTDKCHGRQRTGRGFGH
ncbi:MAG: choice-of-anchor Q domain-containing protein, partial [Actinomycetota bacterium]